MLQFFANKIISSRLFSHHTKFLTTICIICHLKNVPKNLRKCYPFSDFLVPLVIWLIFFLLKVHVTLKRPFKLCNTALKLLIWLRLIRRDEKLNLAPVSSKNISFVLLSSSICSLFCFRFEILFGTRCRTFHSIRS